MKIRNQKKRRGARLGQHFLTGTWAARKLAESAGIKAGDTVLEIGPGKGALTKELLKTGARVVAIEKDPALVQYLRETFINEIGDGHLILVAQDVRDFQGDPLDASKGSPWKSPWEFGPYILAANIPYYITGEIIRQFLSADMQPKTMALLVQKEVADRIVARDKKESILSLSVKAYGAPSVAAKVSRGNFSLPPSVDSAILVVKDISKDFFSDFDEGFFFRVVRTGFSSKRKFLAGNLAKVFGRDNASAAFSAAGLPETIRAEDLSLEKWEKIARALLR